MVSIEMDAEYSAKGDADDISTETVFASMESLFLYMFHEILPELKSLITHTFASHTIRTLLLLLSGRPVSSATTLIQSRKKENIPMNTENVSKEVTNQIAVVPQSFHEAVGKVLAVANEEFTTEELRMLAVHQIGSPALQIMLQLEMVLSKKERRTREKAGGTLLGKLTGVTQKDEAAIVAEEGAATKEEGSSADKGKNADVERSFFQNLLYDSVGSHLAESMMRSAPKKDFNMLYRRFIKPRLGSLARNETAAFVVQRVLEKLPKEGLEEAIKEILPQVPGLVGLLFTSISRHYCANDSRALSRCRPQVPHRRMPKTLSRCNTNNNRHNLLLLLFPARTNLQDSAPVSHRPPSIQRRRAKTH